MGTLSAHARNNLSGSQFAGPHRTYPIPDKAHAIDAKARAAHEEKVGAISKAAEDKIDAKANKVIKRGN